MIDLDELERLCREATPEPWEALCRDVRYKPGNTWSTEEFLQWDIDGPITPDGRGEFFQSDASLIAALRNAAPELIAMARRYQLLRRGQRWSVINGIGDELRAEALDAAIDAAMQEQAHG